MAGCWSRAWDDAGDGDGNEDGNEDEVCKGRKGSEGEMRKKEENSWNGDRGGGLRMRMNGNAENAPEKDLERVCGKENFEGTLERRPQEKRSRRPQYDNCSRRSSMHSLASSLSLSHTHTLGALWPNN